MKKTINDDRLKLYVLLLLLLKILASLFIFVMPNPNDEIDGIIFGGLTFIQFVDWLVLKTNLSLSN